jgi:hypothetical protein
VELVRGLENGPLVPTSPRHLDGLFFVERDMFVREKNNIIAKYQRSRANLPFYLGPLIYADLSKDFTEFESGASPIGPCPRVSPTPIAILVRCRRQRFLA